MSKPRVLILWNHVGEDIYARWKEQGPLPLDWDPEETATEVESVQDEMDALVAALREGGWEVECVNAADDVTRVIQAIEEAEPDVVFNLVEYFHDDEGQEANIAGLYELLGVEYTGNRVATLLLCQNKVRTKVLLAAAGLPTPAYMVVHALPVPDPATAGLRYRLYVTPALEDASGGIEDDSVVHDYAQLVTRARHIIEVFEQPALVEQFIDGREIHAAVLGGDPPEVLPLFEMEFDDSDFREDGEPSRPNIISYSAKWDPTTQAFYSMEAVCPARVDEALANRIRSLAVAAFRVMECRDYARVDMRIDADGNPYILEVNPNPDLALGGAFETCAAASGRSYTETLAAIVEQALKRVPPAEPEVDDTDPGLPVTTDQMLVRHRNSDAA